MNQSYRNLKRWGVAMLGGLLLIGGCGTSTTSMGPTPVSGSLEQADTVKRSVEMPPPGSVLFRGMIYGFRELPDEFTPEPGALVELTTLDGGHTVRGHSYPDGHWELYAPGDAIGYRFRASKGGQVYTHHLEGLVSGNFPSPDVTATSPASITIKGKNIFDWDDRLTVFVSGFVPNAAPIPVVPAKVLTVTSNAPLTMVTLNGSGSFDSNQDLFDVHWTWTNEEIRTTYIYSGLVTQGPFPQGRTIVTLTVWDGVSEVSDTFFVWVHPPVTRDPTETE